MSLSSRVAGLEQRPAARADGALARLSEGWRRDREAFQAFVPEDLREVLGARLGGPYAVDTEALASWAAAPFARWAPRPAPGFRLPRVLVAWVLDPPRRFWFGHHCGACGLAVPLYLIPSDDPHPAPDPRPFPACPACGGATGHAAYDRPDAHAEEHCG